MAAESVVGGAVGEGTKTAVVYSALGSVKGAFSSFSFILLILGVLHFVARQFLSVNDLIIFISSLALFVVAGFAITSNRKKSTPTADTKIVWFTMAAFAVWLFIFNGNHSTRFLSIYIPVCFLLIGIFVLKANKDFGSVGWGFLPGIILFLDAGILRYFSFGSIPEVELIVRLVPWWAFLALFTFGDVEGKGAALIRIGQVMLVIYFIVLLVVTIGILDVGSAGDEQINFAQMFQEGREAERATGAMESLKTSDIALFVKCFDELQNFEECKVREANTIRAEYLCENEQNLQKGTLQFEECVQETTRRFREEELGVEGNTAKQEPVTVKFVEIPYFPQQSNNPRDSYGVNLEIENPREEIINVEIKGNFTKGRTSIPCEIEDNVFTVTRSDTRTILCVPTENLNGTYTLEFTADITDLQSKAILYRAFVMQNESPERIDNIKDLHFSKLGSELSEAPEDLARLNFAMGNPVTFPVIKAGMPVIVAANIENLGGGKITKVHEYGLEIEGASGECLHGVDISVPQTSAYLRNKYSLGACTIELPSYLTNIQKDHIFTHFEGFVKYDYQLSKKFNRVQVNPSILVS